MSQTVDTPAPAAPETPAVAPVPAPAARRAAAAAAPKAVAAAPRPPRGEVVNLPAGAEPRAAPPAAVRPRHRLAALSFLLVAVLPSLAGVGYLYGLAADQYRSTVAFSVRSSETTAPVEFLGALTQSFGGGGQTDAEIVYEFIRSQQMVEAALAALPLREIYNLPPDDVVFRLGEDRPIEDVHDYWRWMTTVSFDGATGIVNFTARAFDPESARRIAAFVLAEATRIVNDLSRKAREDSVEIAAGVLAAAEDRLREARLRMRDFREQERKLDPTETARASLSLIAGLEEKLAEARIELDTQTALIGAQAPQIPYLRQRIDSLRQQIAEERAALGAADPGSAAGLRMADQLAEYEEMQVDREFAERAYLSALAAYEQAQVETRRQMRYLSPHVEPTLAVEPRHPQRALIGLALFVALSAVWAVGLLVAYNIRDRR